MYKYNSFKEYIQLNYIETIQDALELYIKQVKSKFIKAYNQVMVNKEQVINDANEVIKALTDTSLIDNAISETESKLEIITELVCTSQ